MLESEWKNLKVARTAKTAMEEALASVASGVDELTKGFEKRNYYNC